MKLSIAQKWVKALRSGRYKQGKMALRTKTKNGTVRHCCLGVLCELYNEEHEDKLKIEETNDPDHIGIIDKSLAVFKYGTKAQNLPCKVVKWAGLCDANGTFQEKLVKNCQNLYQLNDIGTSFKKIADIIEEQYVGL